MKKFYFLFLIVIAFLTWNVFEIRLPDRIHPSTLSIDISSSPQKAYAAELQNKFLTKMLSGDPSTGATADTAWYFKLYRFSRGLLNLSLFLFLVYIAFRNILNLGIEAYTIKKMLPRIIFAAFVGNLIGPILTVASSIVDSIIYNPSIEIFQTHGTWSWLTNVAKPALGLQIGWTLFNVIMALSGQIILTILSALLQLIVNSALVLGVAVIGLFMAIRPWIVLLAAAAGPIAIGLSILPETESVFKKWLKIISFWLVYPIIINAIHYVMTVMPTIMTANSDTFISGLVSGFLPTLLRVGLFLLAIRLPFTWEKDVGGLIANLPNTTITGAKKYAGGAFRVIKGAETARVLGSRGLETVLANKRGDMEAKSARAGALATATTAVDDVTDTKMQARRQRYEDNEVSKRIRKLNDTDPDTVRTITGGEGPKPATLQKLINKYRDGTLAASNPAAHAYIYSIMPTVRPEARKQLIEEETKTITEKARGDAIGNLKRRGPDTTRMTVGPTIFGREIPILGGTAAGLFKFLRANQTWTVGNIDSAWRSRMEYNAKEMEKAGFRFDQMGKYLASPEVDTKRQAERKAADFQNIDSTDEAANQMSKTLEKFTDIWLWEMHEAGIRDATREEAILNVMKRFHDLDQAAESMLEYNKNFLGKKGYKLDAAGTRVGDELEIDTNDMGTMIAGQRRLTQLANIESRSYKPIEEQRDIRDQVMAGAYMKSLGGPGESMAGRPDLNARPELRPRYQSPGEMQINQNLRKINETIMRNSGLTLVRQLNNQFNERDFDQINPEDYSRFVSESEGDLLNIGRILAEQSGQETADQFTQELKQSRGLATPLMLQRAEELGGGERVSRLVVDYGQKQMLQLSILNKNENLRAVQGGAATLSERAANDPAIVEQLNQALDTHFKEISDDPGFKPSPAQALAARTYLASQSGISDPSALTEPMIENIRRQVRAISFENPENPTRNS